MEEVTISGKVAEVVSDREVILNRGSDDGVYEGMYFSILDPRGMEVKDPDSGESLGSIKRVKIVVVAAQVAPKLTLATTFRTKTVNIGGTGTSGIDIIAKSLSSPKFVEQVERLRIDKASARPLTEEESIVSVGDPFESTTKSNAQSAQTVSVWE